MAIIWCINIYTLKQYRHRDGGFFCSFQFGSHDWGTSVGQVSSLETREKITFQFKSECGLAVCRQNFFLYGKVSLLFS